MSIGHVYVLFGEVSIQVLCLFFNWVVWGFLASSFVSTLSILYTNPLSDVLLVNIFSHSVGGFVLLMVSFAVQNLF